MIDTGSSAPNSSSSAASYSHSSPTRRPSLASGSLIGSSLNYSPPLCSPGLTRLSYRPRGLESAETELSDEEGCKLKANASPAQLAYFEQLTDLFEVEADAKGSSPSQQRESTNKLASTTLASSSPSKFALN